MNIIIPKSYGKWSNPEKAGNSIWFPDMNSIPERSNDTLFRSSLIAYSAITVTTGIRLINTDVVDTPSVSIAWA